MFDMGSVFRETFDRFMKMVIGAVILAFAVGVGTGYYIANHYAAQPDKVEVRQ